MRDSRSRTSAARCGLGKWPQRDKWDTSREGLLYDIELLPTGKTFTTAPILVGSSTDAKRWATFIFKYRCPDWIRGLSDSILKSGDIEQQPVMIDAKFPIMSITNDDSLNESMYPNTESSPPSAMRKARVSRQSSQTLVDFATTETNGDAASETLFQQEQLSVSS